MKQATIGNYIDVLIFLEQKEFFDSSHSNALSPLGHDFGIELVQREEVKVFLVNQK